MRQKIKFLNLICGYFKLQKSGAWLESKFRVIIYFILLIAIQCRPFIQISTFMYPVTELVAY